MTRPCLPPSFFYLFICFCFLCWWRPSSGVLIFPRFGGRESLFRVDGAPEERSGLGGVFFFHRLLLLILGPQGVVGWWWGRGGSAGGGGGASKRWPLFDWLVSQHSRECNKKGSLVLTSSFVGLRHWSFSCQCSELPSCPAARLPRWRRDFLQTIRDRLRVSVRRMTEGGTETCLTGA